jgi:Ca-activated chloride channel family protein
MHWVRPEYLNLLWGLPLLGAFFIWSFRRRRRRLRTFAGPALAARLTSEYSRLKSAARALLLAGFFAFGILALARPQWGIKQETVRRKGVDVIAALDTSFSMGAEDVAPDRLSKAKSEIRGLVSRLKGDRIGLVAFAGTAAVQCPLTLDYGAAVLFLDIASTDMIPQPGTSLAAAIETATSAFIAREKKYKVLVIVTDGEDLEGQVEGAVKKAVEGGVVIYAIGVGSPEGRPIPMRDANGAIMDYRKDANGQVVVSRLDERSLAEIASETGGRYFRATTSEGELDQIYDEISRMEKKQLESRLYQNFEDQFQYPLSVAVACLAAALWITERRRAGTGLRQRFRKRVAIE